MANTPSAKKRIRQSTRKTNVNKARRSRIKTFIKRVEDEVLNGDGKVASETLRAAQSEIQRGVTKGVMHKNTASRKMSRLTKKVKSVA